MASALIFCQVEEGVATLTLNRPPLNILNIPILRELMAALENLAGDTSVRALILRAEGKVFCAGVEVADHTPDRVGEMIPLFDRTCRALVEFPLPTIAVVHGHALGGGCELMICCDLAVMAESAQIGQPEIQLAALAPIAALRLPTLVGYRTAANFLFSGTRLSAYEALQLGLVNAVVPPDEVNQWGVHKASEFASMSRVALALNKHALNIGFGGWADRVPEIERLYLQELMGSADAREGMVAFLEKRPPVWTHQ
jgi:cyclohexa-1,5-dienecarbonyl-CoA hydratase